MGSALQAQANDATGMNIERIEPLAHDAMPHLDAGVVKSMCTGTQTVAKAKDDPSAVNCVHVGSLLHPLPFTASAACSPPSPAAAATARSIN